jgi:hypothetical protein
MMGRDRSDGTFLRQGNKFSLFSKAPEMSERMPIDCYPLLKRSVEIYVFRRN